MGADLRWDRWLMGGVKGIRGSGDDRVKVELGAWWRGVMGLAEELWGGV